MIGRFQTHFFGGVGGGGGGDGRIREFAEGARSEGVNRWAFGRTTKSGVSEDPTNYQNLPKSDSMEAAKQTGG